MARKRMILEEIEEKNNLVPGNPDNPITIGEKAKDILVSLKLYEDDGRGGTLKDRFGYAEYQQARERLEYLKLIEYRPKLDAAQIETIKSTIKNIRQKIAVTASDIEIACSSDELFKIVGEMQAEELKIKYMNTTAPFLTDAGRAVLLSGTVTVKI